MKQVTTCVVLCLALSSAAFPQALQSPQVPPPQRDPAAVAAVGQAIAALGTLPGDLKATGTVHVVAGSLVEDNTIQFLARGAGQSSEAYTTPDGQSRAIYSNGRLSLVRQSVASRASYEQAATGHASLFPLQLLANALSNPDFALQAVGVEQLSGGPAIHVRIWNTYNSTPDLQPVSPFSAQDIWIDTASHLPVKLAYVKAPERSRAPGIPVEIIYGDYRNVSGTLFPFVIERSLNGTPWQTITIQQISLNSGLTDATFNVQ